MESSVRRATFLAGLGAVATCCCTNGAALAQSGAAGRIDVHRHLNPPFYADAAKGFEPQLNSLIRGWTEAKSIADMDEAGITLGYLSMPDDPGIYFGSVPAARALARRCNEYMAELRRKYPGRYGFFAALPLPDVEGSLAEIAYAYDQLKADGINVFSSYGKLYLGDPKFEPLWSELNRRKAIVFEHPSMSTCCKDIVPGVGEPIIEYGADTTRAIASMVFNGVTVRYPDVRIIWSHAGGTMPFLIRRFRDNVYFNPKLPTILPRGVDFELKKMYYDTAQTANPGAMEALLAIIPAPHVLLGTDYPFGASIDTVKGLDSLGWSPDLAATIARGNAVSLFGETRS